MNIAPFIKQHKWLLLIILAGSILRLYALDKFSLWMDEIYTMNVTSPKFTLKEFHDEIVLREGFPYFYFLLVKGFYIFFGYSGFTARLVSALAGIGGIIAIYKLGRHLFTKEAGLCAALLTAINEFHIHYSQEARPYTLFFLFTVIAFLRLSVFIKLPTLKNAVWYGLAAGLMLNVNFFGLVVAMSQGLLVLLAVIFSQKNDRLRTLWHSALAGLIAILLFAPNYEILVKLLKFKAFWVPRPQEDTYTLLFKELLGNSEVTMFIFGVILVYYAVSIFSKNESWASLEKLKSQPDSYSFILLGGWITVYFSYVYIKSMGQVSIALSRYLICLLPVCLLVLAIGITMIRNGIVKKAVLVCIVFFVLTNLVGAKSYYRRSLKSQFREVSAFITQNNKGNTPVYTSLKYWYDFYLNSDSIKTNVIESTLEDHVALMMSDPAQRKAFWYADAHCRPYVLSEKAEAYLSEYFDLNNNIEGFDAWARYYTLKSKEDRGIDFKKFGKLQPVNGDPASASAEQFNFTNNVLEASGWAYFEGCAATNTKIKLLLIKDGEQRSLPTKKIIRPDVTSYFKSEYNIDNSGFKVKSDISGFKPGTYQLAIYLINEQEKKESLIITDKVLQKN